MSATYTSARDGLINSAAIKYPCVAATTANITLSGEQTIDGISVVAGNRVLVKDQTTGSENGVYDVSTSSWTRALDFDGNLDVTQGTLVKILSGTTNGGTIAELTTSGTITIDTTSLTFAMRIGTLSATGAFADTLLAADTESAARTALGLAIGTDVPAYNAEIPKAYTEGTAIASASTIDLDASTGAFVHVTGTTSITAITLADGIERTVVFDGALTLTDGASLLLGGADITTAANDTAVFRGEGSSVTRLVNYQRYDQRAFQDASTTQKGAVSLSTDTQAKAKSSTSVALTPSNLAGMMFESSEITVTAGASSSTLAHGLGVKPERFQVVLVCKTAELGYAIGDEVSITPIFTSAAFNVQVRAISSTYLGYVIGSGAGACAVLNASTGAAAAVTPANWKIVIRAWPY